MRMLSKRSFLLALFTTTSPALPVQAIGFSTACDQYLAARPRRAVSNLTLKTGDWIPEAPFGKIYLPHQNATPNPSSLHYELVSSSVEIRNRRDGSPERPLPVLPPGYHLQFQFAIQTYPIINVYQIRIAHPFPKAGQEASLLTPEENKIVMEEIDRVSLLLSQSLFMGASRSNTVTQLQRDLGSSRVVASQLFDESFHFAAFLYNSRDGLKNKVGVIRQLLLNQLPLKIYLPQTPGSEAPPQIGLKN